jgi:hypothetical protein
MDWQIKKEILENLKDSGFYILRNYLDRETCQRISGLMDTKISNFSRGDGMDYRHPNFENECTDSAKFLHDQDLQDICDSYMETPLIKKRCQAGIVSHDPKEPVCSGGGWHVDKRTKQFKAILYVSDVTEKSGYFSILPGTSSKLQTLQAVPKFEGDNSMTRFSTEELEQKNILQTRVNILGEAGDLILVDTSNVHRGEEILAGKRHSLTNYYYN